jgi:TatD DNase family protein
VIDTHAHLDALDDPGAAVARAREAGVGRILSVGTSIDSCWATLTLAERHAGVFAILGVHPHEAGSDDAGRLDELRALLSHDRAVAVGETGLDFYRDYASDVDQTVLFERQLELADELELPVDGRWRRSWSSAAGAASH